jgi:hypothetical protein
MPEQTPAVINPYWGAIKYAPTELNDTKQIIITWAAFALLAAFLSFDLINASFALNLKNACLSFLVSFFVGGIALVH